LDYFLFLGKLMLLNQTNNMNTKNDYSVEIIRYTIPQDKFESFEKVYQEAGVYLQKSPYCQGYEILHGDEEPNHYIVTIIWTSREDHLNGFRKSAEFSDFLRLVRPFYNNINEMKHYTKIPVSWNK